MPSRRRSRAPPPSRSVSNDRLLTAMADRGYREMISYGFVDPTLQQQLFPETPALQLANPISADLSEMRVSLWPGSCRPAAKICGASRSRVRLFEIGNKFRRLARAGSPSCAKSNRWRESPPARDGRSSGAAQPRRWIFTM